MAIARHLWNGDALCDSPFLTLICLYQSWLARWWHSGECRRNPREATLQEQVVARVGLAISTTEVIRAGDMVHGVVGCDVAIGVTRQALAAKAADAAAIAQVTYGDAGIEHGARHSSIGDDMGKQVAILAEVMEMASLGQMGILRSAGNPISTARAMIDFRIALRVEAAHVAVGDEALVPQRQHVPLGQG